ncbi:hypothetical protein TRICI_005064 [Trichomonascus ciferrii]|uniref:Uncharacterized protein n=1 Tax=Trichomonascus ciferrii TaxID=44093 RepID=A0A642V308_9ASCO|nr:hypothetical protein TRICI_005064 [Trichomonascus ciferrii]
MSSNNNNDQPSLQPVVSASDPDCMLFQQVMSPAWVWNHFADKDKLDGPFNFAVWENKMKNRFDRVHPSILNYLETGEFEKDDKRDRYKDKFESVINEALLWTTLPKFHNLINQVFGRAAFVRIKDKKTTEPTFRSLLTFSRRGAPLKSRTRLALSLRTVSTIPGWLFNTTRSLPSKPILSFLLLVSGTPNLKLRSANSRRRIHNPLAS